MKWKRKIVLNLAALPDDRSASWPFTKSPTQRHSDKAAAAAVVVVVADDEWRAFWLFIALISIHPDCSHSVSMLFYLPSMSLQLRAKWMCAYFSSSGARRLQQKTWLREGDLQSLSRVNRSNFLKHILKMQLSETSVLFYYLIMVKYQWAFQKFAKGRRLIAQLFFFCFFFCTEEAAANASCCILRKFRCCELSTTWLHVQRWRM